MVEFACSWCTLWFCLCVLCLLYVVLSLSCRIVVVLCPLPPARPAPSPSSSSHWPSKPGLFGDYDDDVALPPFFLSSSVPPLPFVHPLTSIFLSSVCVCPFCDVIPEDTDSPSWTNSGLSFLLLHLLPFLNSASSPSYSTFIHPVCLPGLPSPPTSPHLSRLFFFCFACLHFFVPFALLIVL